MKKQLRFSIFPIFLFCFFQLNAQAFFEDQATALGVGDSSGTIFLGGGISFCDFNDDGWDDITIGTQSGDPVKIYKNNGDGTFSLETNLVPNNNAQQKQVIWVDFDNDGDKDLFVAGDVDGSRLYRNDANTLVDVTSTCGLPTAAQDNYGASWGDYDNDGYLDVFLCNRGENIPQANYLYKNNGDGTFSNVSAAAGIDNGSHLSFCSAFFDYNNDGWQDIYMANDKVNTTNILYRNNGDGTFSNVASGTGTMFESIAWGSVFLDAENDGDLDLYVSGSFDGSNSFLSAAFYTNNGSSSYSIETSSGFENDEAESYSNAIGDTDNDGYPEIIVNNSGGDNIFLWKNESTSTNNWLKVNLEGVTSNKQGVGATIEINSGSVSQYRYTVCGEGYISQNSETEFFGIGSNATIDYVKVTWLGGAQDILYNVAPNQVLNITEGSSPLSTEEFESRNAVQVYPNPTTGKIWLHSDKNETYEYIIFDSKGTQVKKGQITQQNHINISTLSTGYYLLKIMGEKAVFNKKIMLK